MLMLAKDYTPERVNWRSEVYSEPKLDGVRVCAVVSKQGEVTFYSRNGRKLTMFDHLLDVMSELRADLLRAVPRWRGTGFVMDGEMVANSFSEISGAIHTKGVTVESARYAVFHVMALDDFRAGADRLTQLQTRADIMRDTMFYFTNPATPIGYVPGMRVHNHKEVMELNAGYKKQGFEGSIIKDMASPWTAKRSWAWMKIKDELSIDVPVLGMKEGTGKYKGTCGALIVQYKGKEVPVSGMTDEERHKFWANPKSIVGKIVEVEYQQETVHGKLRHPRFKRIRFDK